MVLIEEKVKARKRDTGEGLALLAVIMALAVISAGLLAWQSWLPRPLHFGGLTFDRLSAALTLLVAGVGAACFRFSLRYLDGEPSQQRFLNWLAATIGSAYVLMLSTNLLLLFAAWSMTSMGLHKLLTFYEDNREAWRPARKKFLISRLGDLALVATIALVWRDWGTFDLRVLLSEATGSTGGSTTAIGLLVVVAALTKSAQFPFHSWLPETMEAPTPVSALMHAGVINAGGALLLRFAPLIVRVPVALLLLSIVGTATAVLGVLAMWAQVKVKRTLAWSTVAQMGFMMVQCGLAAFPAALLHIVGHGCYKAWSFLRSGGLPAPAAYAREASTTRTLVLAGVGTALAIPALAISSWLTGFSPWHSPGELALVSVVALSIGQLWVVLNTSSAKDKLKEGGRVLTAIVATFAVSVSILALYQAAGAFLAPVLGDLPAPAGPLAWISAIIPIVSFTALVIIHAFLPDLGRTPSGRAFYVHALHGFYYGALADRFVDQVWSRFSPKGHHHA